MSDTIYMSTSLFIDTIRVSEARRPIDERTVEMLMESIEEVGLLNPIQVYLEGDDVLDNVHLVCGRHRLEAARRLGWGWIRGVEVSGDEIERELIEIDENLIRKDLSELEQSNALKRRKELFDAKGAEKIPTPGGEQTVGFDKDTADKTGMDKSTVRKSRTRAEKIADDVQNRIKDNPEVANKGVELDALASLTHDEQRQAVDRIERFGESAREAKDFIRGEEADQIEQETQKLWKLFIRMRTHTAHRCLNTR